MGTGVYEGGGGAPGMGTYEGGGGQSKLGVGGLFGGGGGSVSGGGGDGGGGGGSDGDGGGFGVGQVPHLISGDPGCSSSFLGPDPVIGARRARRTRRVASKDDMTFVVLRYYRLRNWCEWYNKFGVVLRFEWCILVRTRENESKFVTLLDNAWKAKWTKRLNAHFYLAR